MGRPVVGLLCDRRRLDDLDTHLVFETYITAIRDGVGALPVLLPALEAPLDPADILDAVDGLLFPGSPSNVNPALYGGAEACEPKWEDQARDSLAMPLLKAAIARRIPVLCICRGLQELNVALGGTLHQQVHTVPGRFDHREDQTKPQDVQWGLAHDVTVTEGGLLHRLTGLAGFAVNSLHGQGIDRLASPLKEEARAMDGQIEAVSAKAEGGFLLGVQWHPEWRWAANPVSQAIFAAFAQALASQP
jgi:Predicted glutamine amidotransferases